MNYCRFCLRWSTGLARWFRGCRCPRGRVPSKFAHFAGLTRLIWPHQQDNQPESLGLSGTIHEEAHRGLSYCIQSILKALSPNYLLVQHIPPINHSIRKKNFRQSRVHLILLNFSVWPLVPLLLLLSSVNKSWSPIIDLPWDILKTSIKSCLFLLSCHNTHCAISRRKKELKNLLGGA